jgi:DNA invertase Pin-like site-specific DNA recombinase
VKTANAPDNGVGALAFYGRCSTEDNQDPETSLAWQISNAQKFVEPLGGRVVAEYFDIGQSRSVPWERRDVALQLLAELKNRTAVGQASSWGRAPAAGSATSSR